MNKPSLSLQLSTQETVHFTKVNLDRKREERIAEKPGETQRKICGQDRVKVDPERVYGGNRL